MVYLSQPTEYGTLYSKKELAAISALCREKRLPLYIDGARLAYALACPENDVTLRDLSALCDIFYIGGTKCGALLGEAVVIPQPGLIPHFFTIIKQHGALLAKGTAARHPVRHALYRWALRAHRRRRRSLRRRYPARDGGKRLFALFPLPDEPELLHRQ